MLWVFVQCSQVDDNVVDVHVRGTTAVCEEVFHGALEGTGGVAKSKGHYVELQAPKRGLKRS